MKHSVSQVLLQAACAVWSTLFKHRCDAYHNVMACGAAAQCMVRHQVVNS
jgi:hypothetical protein